VPLTDAMEQALLNHIFNDPAFTPDANIFVALSTTTPTDAGGNFTEPVGNGYGRVSTAAADWAAASGTAPASKANGNAITFPSATGAWGTVTHFGLFSASTGGTLRAWGALTTSRAPASGDVVRFAIGALIVKLGKPTDTY
jgi:hypothetical protein